MQRAGFLQGTPVLQELTKSNWIEKNEYLRKTYADSTLNYSAGNYAMQSSEDAV